HAEAPGGGAVSGFEFFADGRAPRTARRLQTEGDADRYRNCERKREYAHIDTRLSQPWNVRGTETLDQFQAEVPNGAPDCSTRDGQKKTLRHQLPDETGPRGAQRKPQRDLRLTASGVRKHQAGDARVHEQDDQSDRAQQHLQPRSDVSDHFTRERRGRSGPAAIELGWFRLQSPAKNIHFALRGTQVRLQPSDPDENPRAPHAARRVVWNRREEVSGSKEIEKWR